MKTKITFKCNLCFWEWESRVEHPAQCPRCKRYDWRKKGEKNGEKRGKEQGVPGRTPESN